MSLRGYIQRFSSFKSKRKSIGSGPEKPLKRSCSLNTTRKKDSLDTYVNNVGDSKNFWNIGNYKYAVERCENGFKIGNELIDMINERANIEETYAKSLKEWHKKYTNHLRNKSDEYETSKDAWQTLANTANLTSEIHMDTSRRLKDNAVGKIKAWLKKNYDKKMFNMTKEAKEFETEFQEAESLWAKYNEKLNKEKTCYYKSIQKTRQCEKAVSASRADSKISNEQSEKLEDKLRKAQHEQEAALNSYKQILIEMKNYQPKHVEKMSRVFEKTQEFEKKRILFYKSVFLDCHGLLQTHHDPRFETIFLDYLNKVEKTQPKRDLEWWSRHFGCDTEPCWPQFEEYDK